MLINRGHFPFDCFIKFYSDHLESTVFGLMFI